MRSEANQSAQNGTESNLAKLSRAEPSPADMIKFLNVAVPLIYTMNHTGVALASQTLGCTAVPDEFMDYCALQRLLLIRAAPQSLPFAQKSALLASVLQPLARDFRNTEPSREPPRRAQVRDFTL